VLPLSLTVCTINVRQDRRSDDFGASFVKVKVFACLNHSDVAVHLQRHVSRGQRKLNRWRLWPVAVVLQRLGLHDVVLLDDTLQLMGVCLELSVRSIHSSLRREAKLQHTLVLSP
jgi:hypothetical protein